MKKSKINLKNVAIIIACLTLTIMLVGVGCKKESNTKNTPTDNMQKVDLSGLVTDKDGNPLNHVLVTTGSLSVTTESDGKFSFKEAEIVNRRVVIKFEKSGYFTLTRSGYKENEMFIEAVLCQKGNSNISVQTTFTSSEAKTLEVSAGMKVKLAASSVMRADGSAFSGTVKADMLYLSPDNKDFAGMMPGGDLAAIRENNSEVMLVS